MEKVFLTNERVVIDSKNINHNGNHKQIFSELTDSLLKEVTVIDEHNTEKTLPQVSDIRKVSINHYCSIMLNNGKIGLIIGVSRPGVFGNYFFQAGSKHISKMGDIDTNTISEIMCGEKIS